MEGAVQTAETGAQTLFDFSTIDTSQLVPTLVAAAGAVMGVVIAYIGVKKGINYAL